MPPQGSAPDSEGTLHLRCGSDIAETLQVAGFRGAFLEFADPFCQGPLPDLPLEAFIETRAAFIAEAYGLSLEEVRGRQRVAYEGLARVPSYDSVVLWFEHDSYDQLILAFLFDGLGKGVDLSRLEVVCVDRFPGVDRFVGLGQLSPEQLLRLWNSARRPVTAADVDLGRRVWAALRRPEAGALAEIAQAGTEPVPFMAAALRRHLQELPSVFNGLSLTQQLALEILRDEGPLAAGRLFRLLMTDREPLPFLGDLMFWYVLRDLQNTSEPLLHQDGKEMAWPRRTLALTGRGQEVLAGERDFLGLYRGSRWVGGVRIAPGQPCARWDAWKDCVRPSA